MKSNSENSIFYPLVMKWLSDEKLLPVFKLKLLFALKTVNDFPIRVFYKILNNILSIKFYHINFNKTMQ